MKSYLRDAWSITKETFSDWDDDRAMSLAASFAFYTLLSLAPLLVIAVSGAALFYGQEAARGEISAQLSTVVGTEPAHALQAILASARASSSGVLGTVVGFVVLFFGASGMFTELQSALNAVWSVQTKPGRGVRGLVRDRLLAFLMVIGAAVVLFASLLLSAVLSAVGTFVGDTLPGGATVWQVASTLVSFVLTIGLFTSIFKILPDAKVPTRDALAGAATAALLFTLGKWVLGVYIGKASFSSAYGAAGSFVALVVWIYYSAQILLLGAELAQVVARRRGLEIEPTANAIRIPSSVRPAHDLEDARTTTSRVRNA
jgi:membrane protein